MADIIPVVPWRWVESPNHAGPRARTLGVFIHSTRGGTTSLETDYQATVSYCSRINANQVGPHYVVGPVEVTRMIHDADTCWCQTVDNDDFLGIEVAQPSPTTAYVEFQYRAAADLCAQLSIKYKFPAVHLGRQTTATVNVPGIIGHDESYAGYSRGKTDPGTKWDWPHFMALMDARLKDLTAPPAPAVHPDIVAYLKAHPELGTARPGDGLTYQDAAGDWVCKTTVGAWVVWRKYYASIGKDPIGVISWKPPEVIQVPVYPDRAATLAALAKAQAGVDEAKAIVEAVT